jgi:alpha-ketoglutarate-dependent sulfate ester dioxygenase
MSTHVLEKPSETLSARSHPTVEFTPLTAVLGAEVKGIDLREALDAETVARLKEGLLKYKVLFFRDQPITDEQQVRFSRYFGPVTPAHPVTNGRDVEHAEIMENVQSAINSRRPSFNKVEKAVHRASVRHGNRRGWHTDITFVANPADLTFLRAYQVAEVGGDTAWVDLEAFYDSLSPALRGFLDTLHAGHFRHDALNGFAPPQRFDGRDNGAFLALHPLVRVHPETGRKSVFLSPAFIKYVEELNEDESEALLAYLKNELAARIDLQVRFHWTPNALVVWDNRNTTHWGPVDAKQLVGERIVRRTTVGNSRPVGPDGFESQQIAGDPFYTLD